MLKKIFLSLLLFFLFMPVSKAAYYYVTDDNNYMLCDGEQPGCISVTKGQDGVTFNLNDEEIWKNGYAYYFDEYYQNTYYESLYGKTRMFFYQKSNGDYVLCKTENSCNTYSFDKLIDMGAIVTNKSQIEMGNKSEPGATADIYYYNSLKNEEINNSNNQSDNNDSNNNVNLESSAYCGKLKEPLKFVGNIVVILKILIPIIIIFFGILDFIKALTASKDDEIRKAGKSLAFRCLSGVVIFLLPTLVSVVFSLVDSWADIKGEFNACQKCVLNVKECK